MLYHQVTRQTVQVTIIYYLTTVKFLIVAAFPIKAAPQTFKKLQFFYKKFPTLKTSN